MLKLKVLSFQNIGRFTSLQTIDFSELSGLIQVDAHNKNTGGSSGSGKSTIFLALEYLLGLNSQPLSILQSRLTDDRLIVSGEFDLDGLPLILSRSKNGLSINLNGEIVKGSAKLTEEKLLEILGMDAELFRLIMHKRQNEKGFFLNLSNKETYQLLSNAKGLDDHNKKAELIDQDLKTLVDSELKAKTNLESTQSGLKSTLEALSAVGDPPKASFYSPEHIQGLKTAYKQTEDLLNATESIHSREKSELAKNKPNIPVESFDRTAIVQIDSKLADLQIQSRALERKELSRQQTAKDQVNALKIKLITAKSSVDKSEKAKIEVAKIVSSLKSIKENICPTCERPEWVTDTLKVKESELLQAFETQKSIILIGMQASQEIESLQESVDTASNELTPQPILELIEINKKELELREELNSQRKLEAEHSVAQSAIVRKANDEYVAKLNLISSRQSSEKSVCQEHLSKVKQELAHAEQDFMAAQVSIKRYEDTLKTLLAQKTKKEAELAEADKSLAELKEKLEIVSEAKILVKSFISCSFDSALESIGDRATEIIRGIPNMATATVQLEGIRETAKGITKEEVTAVLSVDGEQNVPIKSLSGGERSSVDLAIDLAVVEFLELSTGKGSDFMVLDEPFCGLDSVSIERILELLQSSNLDKKLIIVDHNEIIKEYVQNKIVVTREGDFSTVEVL